MNPLPGITAKNATAEDLWLLLTSPQSSSAALPFIRKMTGWWSEYL